jgi:hypothetical protein
MESTPSAVGDRRPAAWLILFSIPMMATSACAWGVIALLEAIGGYDPDPHLLFFVPLLPLPGALIGAIVAWRSGRWWPWWVGLTLTFLPALLALVLAEPFDPDLGNREWGD